MSLRLRSLEFRREREASWRELATLVDTVEKRGIAALDAVQLARLPVLYRAALSSLSVARAISLDKNLLDYLEALAARAYFCVYGVKRPLGQAVRELVGERFPATFRRLLGPIGLSAALFVAATLVAFVLTLADENRYYSFVGGMAQGRTPASTSEELREVLYHTESAADVLSTFASALFTNNASVGILAFALGFAFGLPTVWLIAMNGLGLGGFAALYHSRGLSFELWAWLLPHGITELAAVIICGGAGLVLGQSLLFPGEKTRLANLAERGRDAGVLVLGAVGMSFVAGLIEGIFRQTVHDVAVRYAVAGATLVFWTWYFARAGRRR